jgi:hypothetical protein
MQGEFYRSKLSPSAAAVWTVVGEYIYSPTTPILQQWGDFGRVAELLPALLETWARPRIKKNRRDV